MVDDFVRAFDSTSQKELAIKYTVMPLNQILKAPAEPKWRNVNTTSSFLKQVSNLNATAVARFFENIGFSKTNETTFKFQKSDTNIPGGLPKGNINTISEVVKMLNTKLSDAKKGLSLAPTLPVPPVNMTPAL